MKPSPVILLCALLSAPLAAQQPPRPTMGVGEYDPRSTLKVPEHLDSLPNMVTELGTVIYEMGRQPRAAREFFVKAASRRAPPFVQEDQ